MTAIYRNWDREALDKELNLRARWPEHADFFARWAEESRAVRGRTRCLADAAYGESPGERLDLFLPESGSQAAPLVVFIHGGYWQSLDKSDFSYLAPAWLDQGAAFASLNYDLAPKAPVGEMVRQMRRAVAWLHRNAGAHGIDANRILVTGHSAGGHLAVMVLLTDWAGAFDLPAETVAGGCSISGIYNLEPMSLSYHQPVLNLTAEEVETLSPIRLSPAVLPPLVVAVGGDETEEFQRQQAELAEAWQGHDVRQVEMPGYHHFDIVERLSVPGDPLYESVKALVDETAGR